MDTHGNQLAFDFHRLGRRHVVAKFDGGLIFSGGGGVLLRHAQQRSGIIRQFAGCFTDHRVTRT